MSDWFNSKPLAELNAQEWEALCDGCAKCCLHKLEDADSGEVFYTKVRCRYLDEETCRCTDYANRSVQVPNCIHLQPENLEELAWLPSTCAYRLRFESKPLPAWHPLVSGDPDQVHKAGISVRRVAVPEQQAGDPATQIIPDWR